MAKTPLGHIPTISGEDQHKKGLDKVTSTESSPNMAQSGSVTYKREVETIQHARDKTTKKHKHGDKPTLNNHGDKEMTEGVYKAIKAVDSGNIMGAIPPMLDAVKKIADNMEPLKTLKGITGDGLFSTIMGMMSQINQQNSQGKVDNQPKPGDPCSIGGGQGTLQYVNSVLTCVGAAVS